MLRELLNFAERKYPFGTDDFFQQLVGSMLLSAPFMFTEEIWRVASGISTLQAALITALTAVIGYGVLYVASGKRDWNLERKAFGITFRYISLLLVSMGSIALLLALTSAPSVFEASAVTTVKMILLVSIFSVIGAATADNLI